MHSNTSQVLSTYHAPSRKRHTIIAVDIETDGLGGPFLYGGYAHETEPEVVHYFGSLDAWLNIVLARRYRGAIWYAHNGGEYDYKYLLLAIQRRVADRRGLSVQIIAQGNDRVIGLILREGHHRVDLRDSYALVPTSLEKMSATFAPRYQKQAFDHEHMRFDPTNPEHLAYLRQDVLGLLHSLLAFYDLVTEQFHVEIGWTIAATALRAWRATLTPTQRYTRQRPVVESFCREGYYGGLVFLTSTRLQHDAVALDVNSMYPSVMRTCGVPVGPACHVERWTGRPGYYRVRASIPQDFPRPFIGYREHHSLCWPTGKFETVTTSGEIASAAALGASFDILEGYCFNRIDHPFTAFITRCETLRVLHTGTAIDMTVKLLQNGLYGKFGARPDVEEYSLLSDFPSDLRVMRPVLDSRTGQIVDHLYQRQRQQQASYMHVEWAAWITAQARLALTRAVLAVGADVVWYGDTDSFTASRAACEAAQRAGKIHIGTEYGAFKLERQYQWFHAGGPKNYQGLLEDGRILDKAKGIMGRSLDAQDHAESLDGQTVQVTQYGTNRTLQVLKKGAAFQRIAVRSYSQLANSVGWVVEPGGRVRPVHKSGEQDEQATSGSTHGTRDGLGNRLRE